MLGFGGPVALANYIRRDLVETRHWLTPEEYENGLALAAACPGPLAAAIGIFLAPVLFTVLAAPILLRYYKHPRVAGFIRGVGVTVVGVLVGTTWLVGKEAVGDWLTAAIAIGSLLVIVFFIKLPEPLVILAGGATGLLTYQVIRPEWLLR